MAGPRVIVVGAGPAGVRAAEALVTAGLRPVVVDESARSGGQIYRRQPAEFTRPANRLYGSEAAKATQLNAAFDALHTRIDHRPDTLAWNITEGALHIVQGTRAEAIGFDALIIASGATDRLMPVPGWTLPAPNLWPIRLKPTSSSTPRTARCWPRIRACASAPPGT